LPTIFYRITPHSLSFTRSIYNDFYSIFIGGNWSVGSLLAVRSLRRQPCRSAPHRLVGRRARGDLRSGTLGRQLNDMVLS